MSDLCKWLHESLAALPLMSFPFELAALPNNGIYFFYERDETWGHEGEHLRIVRVGTHRDGNFRSRISEHYLLDDRKMGFSQNVPAQHERSIFRKNLGRALLNRSQDPYLRVWELDFTSRASREKFRHFRDVGKEKEIELEITQILRQNFSFRCIAVDEQQNRMGATGLERHLIGTVAQCGQCRSSEQWLGRHSPVHKIRQSGLWLVQHLSAPPISQDLLSTISAAIERSRSNT
jgi:hypothetical protein